nr:transmembrane protein 100 [Misgurnus anguillicaudatus]
MLLDPASPSGLIYSRVHSVCLSVQRAAVPQEAEHSCTVSESPPHLPRFIQRFFQSSITVLPAWLSSHCPAFKMGCTTGHFTCQPQTTAAPIPESQSQDPKVPEVLSSLERLSQATGGMEKSWYRCIFPFGIISLVIGVAGTGVTYTYNDLPQTKVVSVVLLIVGFVLVVMATACWTAHKKKRRKKKEGGSLSSEQCPL